MNDAVTLFTQSKCPDGAKAREWLDSRGIRFVERNVNEDKSAMDELAAQKLFVTPLLLRGDERVIGFRPGKLEELFPDTTAAPEI
jgi:glutaredoxin 3